MKLTALEEAFWYDKLSTDGTPDVHIPVQAEVIADWRRRLADFTQYRLPEHPGRFQGLVAVPLQNPRQAAAEPPGGGLVPPVPVSGLVAA